MLEVRKNKFTRSYENSFFREFSKCLSKSFREKNISGVLIGSPVCTVDERLQIDALLLTSNVVCIIDFKNFTGKIELPSENNFETGIWITEKGERIKGGSSNSPFTQLKLQKRRFVNIFNKRNLTNIIFNPLHTVRIVCFQNEVQLIGKIPSKEELNFFVVDKTNYLQRILDIVDVIDKEVDLREESYNSFKKIFRADIFKFDEKTYEDDIENIEYKSAILDFNKLYDDQKEALTKIKSFLRDPSQKILVVQGTTNSGKSHLIPFIQETAYNTNIQEVEIFASSGRIAKNLLNLSGLEKVNSIYSYIYGGQHIIDDTKEEQLDENEKIEMNEKLDLEKIPLKNSDNSDNALFIVDESQLVSDSLYHSFDLVFGSGHLLKDFLQFAELAATNRKVIFIGDPFQLHLGNSDESPLNPSYLEEHYKIKSGCFQLKDKEHISPITKASLKCAKYVRDKIYNSLKFNIDDNVSVLEGDNFKEYIIKVFKEKTNAHFLYFSKDEAHKINLWIKKHILNNGDDISEGDLVLFNNNISIEDDNDPNARPIKIYNGQFATVVKVSNTIIKEEVKEIPAKLIFREIELKISDSIKLVKVLSLENYRLNPKGELSKEETILFKILLDRQIKEYQNIKPFDTSDEYSELIKLYEFKRVTQEIEELKVKLNNGDKVKTKLEEMEKEERKLTKLAKKKYVDRIKSILRNDPSSKYYRLKNSAFLRYGWAMTVHKSMSYKWDEIVFNIDQGENRGVNNENYYRWLYTGFSRATKKVSLINYKPLTPFTNSQYIDNNNGIAPQLFFVSESDDQSTRLKDLKIFILSKVKNSEITIESIDHFNWQERYTFKDTTNNKVDVNFSYNNLGRFNLPAVNGQINDFSNKVINLLTIKKEIESFDLLNTEWRKKEYDNLKNFLNKHDIKFEFIIQSGYMDKITLFSSFNVLSVVMVYNGLGLFRSVSAIYYSNISIWNDFKATIEEINN